MVESLIQDLYQIANRTPRMLITRAAVRVEKTVAGVVMDAIGNVFAR